MNILVTNDDGVTAAGINILFETLSGRHDVYMIAPNHEMSACSSAITVRTSLRLEKISERVYSVDGFPADCVNIGLNGEVIPPVDLVVSGINHGPNMGTDVYFSGTVAAARMAYIFGVSGIALSLDCFQESDHFSDAALFLADYLDSSDWRDIDRPALLNINCPNLPGNKIGGTRYTSLGTRTYVDSYRRVQNNDAELVLQLVGSINSSGPAGSDIAEVRNGNISITPLILDCTDRGILARIGVR